MDCDSVFGQRYRKMAGGEGSYVRDLRPESSYRFSVVAAGVLYDKPTRGGSGAVFVDAGGPWVRNSCA